MTQLHDAAKDAVAAAAADLVDLSHRIHAMPELAYDEHRSAAAICESLIAFGFAITSGVAGLETAFAATYGHGALHVGLLAEYDALPGMGHACGHNIIAASAVGAAIGLAAVADNAGLRVTVFGTPAEEGGAGKVHMLDAGVFDNLHAALMVHPGAKDLPAMPTLATTLVDVAYRGVAAHASAFPEMGINALDATTVTQVAVGLLRQHILPTDRIHGIVTDGGAATQIVPESASLRYQVRAANVESLAALETRLQGCFEAGAMATGATVTVTRAMPVYADLRADNDLTASYVRNVTALGRHVSVLTSKAIRAAGSTDMGNVSHRIPSIHPLIGIGSLPAVPHQPGFASAAVGAQADQAVLDAAVALAWTGLDAALDARLRARLLGHDSDSE